MFYRLLVLAHFLCLAAPIAKAAPKIEPGKLKFCDSLTFESCSDKIDPSKPMYMWFEFAKPVGTVFQETFGSATMPNNGTFLVFVSKNIDTDPIVQYANTILVNRWGRLNSFVLTAQANDATMDTLANGSGDAGKLPQPALGQMADAGFRDQFLEGMAMQADGTQTWEVFLFFKPWNGEVTPKEVFRGKFQYTLTNDNRDKLATYMNPDSRAKFGKEPDDGMKTALHKANAGKIVFGPKKLAADNESAGALATTFTSLDGLGARLYLKHSVRNTLATIGWGKDVGTKPYTINFSVDGKEFRTTSEKLDGDDARKKTTWGVTLAPSNKDEENDNPVITHKFAYVVSTLKPGKHEIKLDAYVGGKGPQRLPLASGSFTLDLTAAKRDAFAKAHGQQLPAKGSIATDKALYKQLKALVPADVVTIRTPKVWEDRFDEFKRLTHHVTILVTGFKDANGECQMGTLMVEQPKTANGWGPAKISTSEKHWFSIDRDLPCQNLVKD
jgi:hypothetical protein